MDMKKLGTINLSGKVVVSDPCYDRDVWCMQDDIAVKAGNYHVYVSYSDEKEFGTRVAALAVVHTDHLDLLSDGHLNWNSVNGSIGVDSGQCGIFDDSIYPRGTKADEDAEVFDSFYQECCNITGSEEQGGILKSGKGVVTSSGFGDGGYELFSLSHKNETVALLVDYSVTTMRDIMRALVAESSKPDSSAKCRKNVIFTTQQFVLPFAA